MNGHRILRKYRAHTILSIYTVISPERVHVAESRIALEDLVDSSKVRMNRVGRRSRFYCSRV